jgi:hypothetical protein
MERERLLTVLTILLGGVVLQVICAWLSARSGMKRGSELERLVVARRRWKDGA